MNFLNKVVIVTGGSSGIGASTAIQFAKEGATVTIVGRNEDKLKQVADKISEIGKSAHVVKADITRDEEAKRIIQETVDKFGKVDILVNNAGFTIPSIISDENFIEHYDSLMNTNLRAVVVLTNLLVPYLKQTKGNIINISSIAGKMATSTGTAHYCTSKAGLDMFTKNCAMELAKFGIRANTVSPGPVETSFFNAAGIEIDLKNVAERFTALKVLTQPNEIAHTILYLASDKARSITGADLIIDAGFLVKDRTDF